MNLYSVENGPEQIRSVIAGDGNNQKMQGDFLENRSLDLLRLSSQISDGLADVKNKSTTFYIEKCENKMLKSFQ